MMKGEKFSQRENPLNTDKKDISFTKQDPPQKGEAPQTGKKNSSFQKQDPPKNEVFSKEPIASREKRKWIEKQNPSTQKTSTQKETTFKFSHEEQKKHSKLTEKAEKRENAYFERDKKLPKRHVLKGTKENDTGKKQVKIHFETSNEVVGGTPLQPLHCGSAKAPNEPL